MVNNFTYINKTNNHLSIDACLTQIYQIWWEFEIDCFQRSIILGVHL
jgi:hypothetical protein